MPNYCTPYPRQVQGSIETLPLPCSRLAQATRASRQSANSMRWPKMPPLLPNFRGPCVLRAVAVNLRPVPKLVPSLLPNLALAPVPHPAYSFSISPVQEPTMEPRLNYMQVLPEGMRTINAVDHYSGRCGLEPALLELVKLRASQINGCAYCVDMHSKDARTRGETE